MPFLHCLNCDLQNEQWPLILTEFTEQTNNRTCDVGNPGPGLGQAQKCVGGKPVNGIPTIPSYYIHNSNVSLDKRSHSSIYAFLYEQTPNVGIRSI